MLALVVLSRAKIEEEERTAPHREGKIIFMLIYRKQEVIVFLYENIYKHVQREGSIGRQLEKYNILSKPRTL